MDQHIETQPGLYLYTSNRLETLAEKLGVVLGHPLASPFESEVIVVRNKGMERWLRLELARRHGISAHQRFPFPEAFGHELFRTLDPALPPQAPLDRETLVWRVLDVLPRLIGEPGFEGLADYLRPGPEERAATPTGRNTEGEREDAPVPGTLPGDPRKHLQLAARIAHLLDQYLIFRPAMMLAWDGGRVSGTPLPDLDDPVVAWQARLWQEVSAGLTHVHAAHLWRRFHEALDRGVPEGVRLPGRLTIFGVSALPPFHLDLFAALGRHLPVHLFLLQPSQEYWGDITSAREGDRILRRTAGAAARSPLRDDPDGGGSSPGAFEAHLEQGNRLLASLGYLGRDFLKLLLDAGDWITEEDFTDPGHDTLLHAIQSDILHLRDRGSDPEWPALELAPGDDSIRVHSCHSPLREMEVLHDQLLECFRRDPTLAPRDIVVMTPDIEAYAPFIQAVFGAAEEESRSIPFSVADRGARGQSHVVEIFLQILELPATRLGAGTVLALLEAAPLRRRFGLEESDLPRIRDWVDDANIRWGRDGRHRESLGLPALEGNTWRAGLDRLVLGHGMKADDGRLFAGILPFDPVEGDDAEVLGRFAAFIDDLFQTLDELQGPPRPLRDWADWLTALVDRFFLDDGGAEAQLQTIRDAADTLRQQQLWSGFAGTLPLEALMERLRPMLEEDRFSSGFLTGGVTFCGLKPMRSIPFKIVCLVGMNDAAFPRTTRHLSFDLMARRPRLGDRSTREDDRYLFLETLLSARDRFIVSHVGQGIRDNKESPPSVVVSELLDYMDQAFRMAGAPPGTAVPRPRSLVIVPHRLQAFHPDYFLGGDRLFSYSVQNCRAGERTRGPRTGSAPFLSAPLPVVTGATAPPGPPAPGEPNHGVGSHQGDPVPDVAPDAIGPRAVTLEELAQFLGNPSKYFLQRRLGVVLPESAGSLDESEPFILGGLEAFLLKQELLESAQAGGGSPSNAGANEARRRHEAAGEIPLGSAGEAGFRSLAAQAASVHRRLAGAGCLDALEPLEFALPLTLPPATFAPTSAPAPAPAPTDASGGGGGGGIVLTGRLPHRTPTGPVIARCAKAKARDFLRAWVTHLVANVVQPGAITTLVTEDATSRFRPVPDAASVLAFLVGLHQAGLEAPLPFFPQSSLAYAEARHGGKSPAASRAKADAAWRGNEFAKATPESRERHFELCFRGTAALGERFETLAMEILGPMLDAREIQEAGAETP